LSPDHCGIYSLPDAAKMPSRCIFQEMAQKKSAQCLHNKKNCRKFASQNRKGAIEFLAVDAKSFSSSVG
ncbi:MAG: hypothetical protein PUD79_04070, partial [Prevotellaceae bacterium]|nr:hypothetical protein [Prevotellaceae bacterium]